MTQVRQTNKLSGNRFKLFMLAVQRRDPVIGKLEIALRQRLKEGLHEGIVRFA